MSYFLSNVTTHMTLNHFTKIEGGGRGRRVNSNKRCAVLYTCVMTSTGRRGSKSVA